MRILPLGTDPILHCFTIFSFLQSKKTNEKKKEKEHRGLKEERKSRKKGGKKKKEKSATLVRIQGLPFYF